MSEREAALVSVGDELLAGAHPDLNAPWLAERLASCAIAVRSMHVAADDEEEIAAAVRAGLATSGLVIVTGGLGPTLDDVTRHGVARALGRELFESEEAVRELARWFEARGVAMAPANRRQALFPVGALPVKNRVGTAPGFRYAEGGREVIVLPGPPREMQVVFEEEILPGLRRAEERLEQRFHLFGLPESTFAESVGDWMERDAEPRMGCTVKKGILSVVIRARGSTRETRLAFEERTTAFRARFAEHLFSEAEPELERLLARALFETSTTVALAESCTGGLATALLARVPGISAVLREGFVPYSNEAKCARLGVAPELIERHGAVSGEVAAALARGAARASGATLGLSVTGIAGPGGGSPEKPVGLVWFGLSMADDVRTVERRFPPTDRDWIRSIAARTLLWLGWRRVLEAAASDPSRRRD